MIDSVLILRLSTCWMRWTLNWILNIVRWLLDWWESKQISKPTFRSSVQHSNQRLLKKLIRSIVWHWRTKPAGLRKQQGKKHLNSFTLGYLLLQLQNIPQIDINLLCLLMKTNERDAWFRIFSTTWSIEINDLIISGLDINRRREGLNSLLSNPGYDFSIFWYKTVFFMYYSLSIQRFYTDETMSGRFEMIWHRILMCSINKNGSDSPTFPFLLMKGSILRLFPPWIMKDPVISFMILRM